MRSPDSSRPLRQGRRRAQPILEGLEVRELLSTGMSAAAARRAQAAEVAHPDSPNGLSGKKAAGPFLSSAVIKRAASDLYQADVPPGLPTPREIRRQVFTAQWVGQYTIGAPRFSDRADTIHLYGVSGGSNEFLKGKFNIALFPPADPSATPTPGNPYANQITGVASLFAQNYLQSGSMLVLDLNGTPGAGSSPTALPTTLSWTYDQNTSAGPYAAPGGVAAGSGFDQGTGTMTLRWIPDAHPLPGTRGSGEVVITFQGLINGSQIVSAVSKNIS